MRKKLSILAISLFLISISLVVWFSSVAGKAFRDDLKQSIAKELVRVDTQNAIKKVDVVYILGGNQLSFEYKIRKVAELYRQGKCQKIWIRNHSGITDYNPESGKNWTKTEWYLMKLKKRGVRKEAVELISIAEGFFGTYSEAKDVSKLLQERKYKSILLIAQPYHTRRVQLSFSKFLAGQNIFFYIIGSGESLDLSDHMVEFIKLKIYQYFLV